MRRTAVVNQIRGLLLERGLTLPKGRSYVEQALPDILEDAALRLSDSFRVLLAQLQLELDQLTSRIEQMDAVLQQTAKDHRHRVITHLTAAAFVFSGRAANFKLARRNPDVFLAVTRVRLHGSSPPTFGLWLRYQQNELIGHHT
jgi:hypothetical protein